MTSAPPRSIWWGFKLAPQRDSQWGSRRTDKHGSTYGLSELPPPRCDSLLPCRAPGVKGEESLCGYYQLGSARKGPWPCCLAPLKEQLPFFALAYFFFKQSRSVLGYRSCPLGRHSVSH